jgi:hypothetical protein
MRGRKHACNAAREAAASRAATAPDEGFEVGELGELGELYRSRDERILQLKDELHRAKRVVYIHLATRLAGRQFAWPFPVRALAGRA